MRKKLRFSFAMLLALGLALCLLSLLLAASLGALGFKAADVFAALLSPLTNAGPQGPVLASVPGGGTQLVEAHVLRGVVLDLRLPRLILSLLAGSALALAGAVFQAILRNPLADPFTLGVSGGAAFGAALAISLGLTGAAYGLGLPLAALVGAGAALFAVLMLGRLGGGLRHETLILAGVVVSAFLAALIALVKALDEASVTGIVFWIMGSFQGRGLRELLLFLPGYIIGCTLIGLLIRELDLLGLGDRAARHMGLNTARSRLTLLLAASALTASCVAVSGIIGFVGLIVPHLARMLLGAAHRHVLPASALAGALLLLWSDTAARTLLPGGVELPVGVITSLLGGPFFCYILGKRQRGKAGPLLTHIIEDSADCSPEAEPGSDTVVAPARVPGSHLICSDLSFTYRAGSAPALDKLSFAVEQGEFVGLLGPNGSGKSTLLQCLSGLLPPGQGQILVAGKPITSLPERQRALLLAALPQRPETLPSLSAFALTLMGRYAHTPFLGAYSDHDKAVAFAALAECGAAHLAARPADCLSGGEAQRVLLARSLAQNAAVLLLDEPTAGLDPACARLVMEAIARRNQRKGLTVLAAMHDLNLAALYCDRLIFLKQGRLAADGPTRQVFTSAVLEEVYETRLAVAPHPVDGVPQALPL